MESDIASAIDRLTRAVLLVGRILNDQAINQQDGVRDRSDLINADELEVFRSEAERRDRQ